METLPPQPVTAPAARSSAARRFVQRHMYRWHRTIGLLTVVPVICWTLSGLVHPLMSNWPVSYTHLTLPTIYSV